jgi:hypothetical protein
MEPKIWYKSKTLWVGVVEILIGVLGLVATFLGAGVFTPEAYVLLVVGALTILLRKLTDTPMTF